MAAAGLVSGITPGGKGNKSTDTTIPKAEVPTINATKAMETGRPSVS